jgi:hypothetical protein
MSTTTVAARQSAILGRLRQTYEDSGYQFFAHPSPELVPPFLRPFSPDAIAVRGDEGIVIEVAGRSEKTAAPNLVGLAERVAGAKGWRLNVYSTADFPREPVIDAPTIDQFAGQVSEVESLARAGQPRAAFLLAWTALEAAARFLLPGNRTRRPLLPEQVVEGLATCGAIEPETAEQLRGLIEPRERIAHGDPSATVGMETLAPLLAHLHEVRDVIGNYRP